MAVSVPSRRAPDAQSLHRGRTVAAVELLLCAIEDKANRSCRLARQGHGSPHIIARTRLGAEAATHRIDDDPHAIAGQLEDLGKLVADASRVLRRHVDGEPIRAPIGHHGVRLEAAMGLHLGMEFALDNHIRFGKALRDVTARARLVWTTHIALLWQLNSAHCAARETFAVHGSLEHEVRISFPRVLDVDDERKRLVIDPDQVERRLRRLGCDGGHCGNCIADIEGAAAVWLAGRILTRCRFNCPSDSTGDQIHGTYAGMPLGSTHIDRENSGMRMWRPQQPGMQHPRQLDVYRETGNPGHFGPTVDTRDWFANDRELGVGSKRRRLVNRD